MNLFPPVEQWRSRTTFVLALALAAVGLGNIWRFGWLLGEHGGAPFLLSYVLCMLLVGVPLLVARSGWRGTLLEPRQKRWAFPWILSAGIASLLLGIGLLIWLYVMPGSDDGD